MAAQDAFALSLLLVTLPPTFDAAATSLCVPPEVTYFSCETKGGKQIAVCGTLKLLRNAEGPDELSAGYLQYRFGTRERIELTYPSNKQGSPGKFTGAYFTPAGAGHASLSFDIGKYSYSVGITGGPGALSFTGVGIRRGWDTVESIPCAAAPVLETRNGLGFIGLTQLLAK